MEKARIQKVGDFAKLYKAIASGK